MTLIFAHRGSAGTHPENTMDAFKAAEKFGADGIELDVQLSSDGEIVVIHDHTVDRTTNGSGMVKDFTLDQLKKLKANYHFKHFFKRSSRIPSLKEVFEWMKGNSLVCNIELKNSEIPYEGLEDKVMAMIREYGYESRIVISSFNHYSLVYCRQICPEVETAPLYKDMLYEPWEYAKSILASGIHPKLRAAPAAVIAATMERGFAVRPYTVNKQKEMKKLFEIRCSAIITDFPEKAYLLREKIQEK
ncbi:MAG TPA: glycerophosphodiester phosphodiesterase [Bacillaceae bacterium]